MVSLVIPVYNNEDSLPRLLREVGDLARRMPGGLEVVFVVDGSPDGSLAFLQKHLPGWGVPSQLLELSRNFGSFAAIAAGLRSGTGDYFAVISADLQEPPELALTFQQILSSGGAEAVFGTRTRRADPWLSQAMSAMFWSLYRRFVLPEMPRGGVDIFGCTRAVRDHLVQLREANTNLIALLLWLGFRRQWVPYERRPRQEGRSAWTVAKRWRYAIDSVFSFTDLPVRVLLVLGSLATIGAVVAAITVLIFWWAGSIPVLGYTPLMLAVTAFGGITALGLGIVGQYLWLTLQNSRARPTFVVRSMAQYQGRVEDAAAYPLTSARNSS
ncbi:MAG TPA: glycosyltransferase family 2 protein [Vicinamibacterales bacterium]|nr:glycosyltransferase family 2 protein [Vicinamibacterales bacterium]